MTKACENPCADNTMEGEEVWERCINLTVGGYALTSQVGSTVGEQDAEKIKKSNFGTVISTSPITKKKKKKICFEIKSKQLCNTATKYLKEGS